MTDPADDWIAAIVARGVAVEAKGQRIVLHPKQAFSAMSADERATLKAHKAAIVEVVRQRHGGWAQGAPAVASATTEPTVTATAEPVAPTPARCPYCMRAPCCGPDHPAFEVLHERDPVAYWTLRARLREKDDKEFELRRRYGVTPIEW